MLLIPAFGRLRQKVESSRPAQATKWVTGTKSKQTKDNVYKNIQHNTWDIANGYLRNIHPQVSIFVTMLLRSNSHVICNRFVITKGPKPSIILIQCFACANTSCCALFYSLPVPFTCRDTFPLFVLTLHRIWHLLCFLCGARR